MSTTAAERKMSNTIKSETREMRAQSDISTKKSTIKK